MVVGGTSYTISVRADTRALQRLQCSVQWGCEVTVPTTAVSSVKLTDTRFQYSLVPAGDKLRIVLLPSAALVDDGGVVAPLQAMLRVILSDSHEYDIVVTAKDIQQSYNLEFSPDSPIADAFTPAVQNERAAVAKVDDAAGKLDPAEMDFGWSATGSEHRCISVFSYRGALWCKLNVETTTTPSAYSIEGKLQRPLNVLPMDRVYLVIQGAPAKVRLVWGEEPGQDVWITRTRE